MKVNIKMILAPHKTGRLCTNLNSKNSNWSTTVLFGVTHPPVEERIKALTGETQ